jgi:chemotaxis protein CheC
MKNNINLSQMEIDQLKEITNIGAGNAATALSHMTGQRVEMEVPESFIGGADLVQRRLGVSTDKVVAVFFKVHGDIEGAMVMILPPDSAIHLTELLTKDKIHSMSEITSEHLSAVKEMGNILLGASTTALNKFLGINIIHTIPDAAVDMLGSVMDEVLLEIGDERGDILVFKVSLKVDGTETKADFYYLFDPESSARVLHHTGKKLL